MPEPTIQVLGAYALPVSEELLREQTDILYGSNLAGEPRRQAERRCREQLESTVLIEAMVRDRDDRFEAGGFCQPVAGLARDNWQAAWGEAYLSVDGESLLAERGDDPPDANDFRVAFFLHGWDPAGRLLTSYGELACPSVQEMPERLRRLVPYEPVD